MNREDVLGSLLDLVKNSSDYKSYGRRLVLSSQVNFFPACYVISVGENYPPREIRQLPAKWRIHAQIWLYTCGGENPDAAPEAALNAALDELDVALKPNIVNGVQTLGLPGVSHCWVEGIIEKFPGVLDGIAKAIVPVNILLKPGY